MVLRTNLFQRSAGLNRDAFHGVLLRDAAAMAAFIPNIRHYALNVVVDDAHRLGIARGPFRLDGISHMWFDDTEELRRAEHSGPYRKLIECLRPYLLSSLALDIVQRLIVNPPADDFSASAARTRLLKRMSILQRSPELTAEAFQRIWEDEHGPRLAAHAGTLRGYIQDAVLMARPEYGESLPGCDGLTELWFESEQAMAQVLPQHQPSLVTSSAASIIATISTYLVREIRYF